MGVFKEEILFLEGIEKRQTQIWEDAADVGVETSRMTPNERHRMREVVKTLLDLPGSKIEYKAVKPALQRQYRLIVMWGAADSERYDATEVHLLYYKDHRKEFFSLFTGHTFTNSEGEPVPGKKHAPVRR